MQDVETKIYLDPKIDEMLEECAGRLQLTKSFIVNVIFKELFKEANPADYFFNRVVLCPEITPREKPETEITQ